jgi:hypothetical protein
MLQGSSTGYIRLLEAAMCHWSSHEYERRLSADPTRSFFEAVRDLFRRKPRPEVSAPEVAAPAAEAEVIPLRAGAGRRVARSADRADAA